jgi:hypothetical protein
MCILQIPENLSDEEAAAIPEVFLTAYQALVWIGGLEANKRVLIHAGVRSPPPLLLLFLPRPLLYGVHVVLTSSVGLSRV